MHPENSKKRTARRRLQKKCALNSQDKRTRKINKDVKIIKKNVSVQKHQLELLQMKVMVFAIKNSRLTTAKKRIGELEEKNCGR